LPRRRLSPLATGVLTAKGAKIAKDGRTRGTTKSKQNNERFAVWPLPQSSLCFALFAHFAVQNDFDLHQPAIVDNFFARVLGVILGRFFGTHRPWRWRPGGFFGGRGAFGKMGSRKFRFF
jgi:hypothetical protein